MGTRCYFPWG